MNYQEEIDKFKMKFNYEVKLLLFYYFNSIYEKYNNWKRYSRHTKKFLKKRGLWDIKDFRPIKDNFQVKLEI